MTAPTSSTQPGRAVTARMLHMAGRWGASARYRAICGTNAPLERLTRDWAKVTCRRCLASRGRKWARTRTGLR